MPNWMRRLLCHFVIPSKQEAAINETTCQTDLAIILNYVA
jgi:hypothetical protein